MTNRTPKMDASAPRAPAIPAPTPADYSDELSGAQVDALRKHAPQDESKMGHLVHEFTWR